MTSIYSMQVIKRKTLHKESVELLKQEAELLQSMDHKNIVKFKHVSRSGIYLLITFFTHFVYSSKRSKVKSSWEWS